MSVHADQLPTAVRKRLGLDDPTGRTRTRPSRAGVGDSAPCPGHCACGAAFPTAAAWQRHADHTGHRRWSIDLPDHQEI